MTRSSIKPIMTSDASLNLRTSDPSMVALNLRTSDPSMVALNLRTSDPSMVALNFRASDPSMVAAQKSSRLIQRIVFGVVIITLVTIIISFVHVMRTTETAKAEATLLEMKAQEVKRINAQPMRSLHVPDIETAYDELDEMTSYLSLFSAPEGADVYQDGKFIGTTPLEQFRFEKADKMSRFIVALDNHDIERLDIRLDETTSHTLKLRPSHTPPAVVRSDTQAGAASGSGHANYAGKAKNKKKGSGNKSNEAVIMLPD